MNELRYARGAGVYGVVYSWLFLLRAGMELMEGRLVIVIPPVACFRSGRYSLV